MSVINSNLEIYDNLGLTRKNETKVEETKQDQFMKLLIAQMENQDPFEPQENGEFLSQLAQFDTATGIKDLQNSFSKFTTTLQSNSALQASSLVGRDVLVPGNESFLSDGGIISGNVDLSASTSSLKIEVMDASGQTIRTLNLGKQAAGTIDFTWDGKDDNGNLLPSGKYRFRASAQVGNETIAQELQLTAKVDSVSIGQMGQGLKLNLLGMGQVDLAQVREIK